MEQQDFAELEKLDDQLEYDLFMAEIDFLGQKIRAKHEAAD